MAKNISYKNQNIPVCEILVFNTAEKPVFGVVAILV